MNIQPRTEAGLPPSFSPTNPNNTLEQKTIPELINVLRATCKFDTFDLVESVLVSRDMRLREEIEQLQKNFEMEKLKFLEKLQMETLLRIQGEEEFRKRKKDELCEKGKRVQESYEALLKEVKENDLAYRDTDEKLRKMNDELDCEVKKLKEKCVDDGKRFDVIRRENEELGCEVLELRKMKEKWVEENNELCMLREMIGKLEQEVLESKTMLKEKWLGDNNVLEELRIKVIGLENENSDLGDKKREIETLYESLNIKYKELCGRVSRFDDDTKLLMSLDGSGGGHNEGESHADPMVTDFEDNGEEDACDGALGNDTVEEAAPLTRNEATHQSPEVAASTQPRNVGGKDGQGASSETEHKENSNDNGSTEIAKSQKRKSNDEEKENGKSLIVQKQKKKKPILKQRRQSERLKLNSNTKPIIGAGSSIDQPLEIIDDDDDEVDEGILTQEEVNEAKLGTCFRHMKSWSENQEEPGGSIVMKEKEFKIVVGPTYPFVPYNVYSSHGKCHRKSVELKVDGVSWLVSLYTQGSGIRFYKGWTKFKKHCQLKNGDTCYLKVIDEKKFVFNVSFNRKNQ